MTMNFHDQIIAIIPKVRLQAMALTRQRSAAEDLVQDAVCNALAASATFIPGTNFSAWMHRIVRNRFISNLRKRRDTLNIASLPEDTFATNGAQDGCLALSELSVAMERLPAAQLEALIMIAIHGLSYEQLAEQVGCAVGTAKSRVFRARQQLHMWLVGDADTEAGQSRRCTDDPLLAAVVAAPAEGLAPS